MYGHISVIYKYCIPGAMLDSGDKTLSMSSKIKKSMGKKFLRKKYNVNVLIKILLAII